MHRGYLKPCGIYQCHVRRLLAYTKKVLNTEVAITLRTENISLQLLVNI